jgi:hypothetical protein
MRQFYAPTEDIIKSAKSWFASDHSAGVTTIVVKNSAQFVAGKYICLGREGDETTELKRITTVTDNTHIEVDSVTVFPHYIDNLITQYDYNQRKLYSRATSDDSWVHVTSDSPKNIAVDSSLGTLFEDAAGTSATQYISTYSNVFASTETDQDDSVVVSGTASSTNLCSLQSIRTSAGWQDNFYVTDPRIDEARQQAQGEVWASLRKRYTFPLTRSSNYLERIVVDMSVGFLFIDEYGINVQNVALDGYKRLEGARKKLEELATGTKTLYDESTGEDQGLSSRDTVAFYPDNSTDNEDDERIFSIGMKF